MRTEITADTILGPGDQVEIVFNMFMPDWLWLRSTLVAIFETQVSQNDNFDVTGYTIDETTDKVIFYAKVKEVDQSQVSTEVYQASFVSTAIVISACTALVGGIGWLLLDKVYQIQDSPAGQIATAGIGAAGFAVLLFVILKITKVIT